MSTENIRLNFKNDQLLSDIKIVLNDNILNLYSALVKKTDFEMMFRLKPKFLSTRNMWYVNSQLVNEFFRKFFIYDLPWKALSKEKVESLVKDWNDVYAI